MDENLVYLSMLMHEKEMMGLPERKNVISAQIALLNRVQEKKEFQKRIVARQISILKKGNQIISSSLLESLLLKKYVSENLLSMFSSENAAINRKISTLKRILNEQKRSLRIADLLLKEKSAYSEIESIMLEAEIPDHRLKRYFSLVASLRYDKRMMNAGRAAAIAASRFFRLRVQGIENIPLDGPCIIAPHHYDAYLDIILLVALVKRPLFFLSTTEFFVSFPFSDRAFFAIGHVPITKKDEDFGQRRKKFFSIPPERVEAFQKDNSQSLEIALSHLLCGDALVIFPEGEANRFGVYLRPNNEAFLRPHTGFSLLALRAMQKGVSVPIVPVGLRYSGINNVSISFGSKVFLPPSIAALSKEKVRPALKRFTDKTFSRIRKLSE